MSSRALPCLAATILALAFAATFATSAHAGFPEFTYDQTTNTGWDYAVDPVNMAHGGNLGNASYIHDRYVNRLGWRDTSTGGYQWVLFRDPNSSATAWRGMAYSLGDGEWPFSRYHARLFQNPFASGTGSDPQKNTVADFHHERAVDHAIDRNWEDVEIAYWYELQVMGGTTAYYDRYINGRYANYNYDRYYFRGWLTDGWISVVNFH